jgi:hypothetical protein
MYLTHTFAHRETLCRAHTWLTGLGFHPLQINTRTVGTPRLMIPVEPYRLAAAQMLINAAESADPDGFPYFWEKTEKVACARTEDRKDKASEQQSKPHSSVIGWHPLD